MERHIQNTLALAQWLEKHPKVASVNYPGLEGNPSYKLAQKYLTKGAGGVLSFEVKGDKDAAIKVVDSLKLVSHLANVGDAKNADHTTFKPQRISSCQMKHNLQLVFSQVH